MHLGSWGAGEPGVSSRKQGTAASSCRKKWAMEWTLLLPGQLLLGKAVSDPGSKNPEQKCQTCQIKRRLGVWVL